MAHDPRSTTTYGRPGNGNGHHVGAEPVAGPVAGPADNSAVGLLGRLINDVSALFRNEIALARAEMGQAAQQAKTGIGSVATGGVVLLAGVLALVASAILGLSLVVAPWLAALIVGLVLAAIGYAMVQAGKKKLEPEHFTLERTQASLRKDKHTVERSLQ